MVTATVNHLCVPPPLEQTVDQHLSTHPQGCVLLSLEQTLAAGLNEVGMKPGVYRAQATGLGFTHYLDKVIVTRTPDLLAVMTAGAYGAVQAGTYNTRALVPEVLVRGDAWSLVRPRLEVDALIDLDRLPPWL